MIIEYEGEVLIILYDEILEGDMINLFVFVGGFLIENIERL